MKKFLLFVSTVFLSLFFVNNKVYAQVNFPSNLLKIPFSEFYIIRAHQIDNGYTVYEYEIEYLLEDYLVFQLDDIDYYFVSKHPIPFYKGYDNRYNTYEVVDIYTWSDELTRGTLITLRVTVDGRALEDYDYGNPANYQDILPFFTLDTALYINYYIPDPNAYNIGYNDGYEAGYNQGYDDGLQVGEQVGYDNGYDEGYNDGYNDGLNDFNVADYFGDRNIAKATGIEYYLVSDPFEPSTSIVVYNAGRAGSNILLDKPYLIVIIKKNIYDYVVVRFDNILIYHYEATYFDIGDYNIYIFDLSDRLNTKYNLEIRKENVTTTEEASEFLNDVVGNIYFSHASKLLTSSIALQFYDFGYIAGLEKNITDSDAYRTGYDTGYNRGYTDGIEDGYELGYEDGFDYGKTVEYEQGYNDGYNVGYNEGIKEPFYSNFHVWIVPAIIIVVIAGIFVGYRRERYSGD